MTDLPKDDFTKELRSVIARHHSLCFETDRSEPDLTAISYQGIACQKKRAWISTYLHYDNGIVIDFEMHDEECGTIQVVRRESYVGLADAADGIRKWFSSNDETRPDS